MPVSQSDVFAVSPAAFLGLVLFQNKPSSTAFGCFVGHVEEVRSLRKAKGGKTRRRRAGMIEGANGRGRRGEETQAQREKHNISHVQGPSQLHESQLKAKMTSRDIAIGTGERQVTTADEGLSLLRACLCRTVFEGPTCCLKRTSTIHHIGLAAAALFLLFLFLCSILFVLTLNLFPAKRDQKRVVARFLIYNHG